MAVNGVGTTTGAELAGTIDRIASGSASKTRAMIGVNEFEAFDSATPPTPPKSMRARVESFFSSIAAKLSNFMQSFSPFSRSTSSDKEEALSQKVADVKSTSDKVKKLGDDMYKNLNKLQELKPPSRRDYMRSGSDRLAGSISSPNRQISQSMITRPPSAPGTAGTERSDAKFPANGITLEKLTANIDTLSDMMQVNSRDLSKDAKNTIIQSPTLVKYLDALKQAGWHIDVQREADTPISSDGSVQMVDVSTKTLRLSNDIMVRNTEEFLEKFATILMLDAGKALGTPEVSLAKQNKYIADLHVIKDEMSQARRAMR
ncbi:hypothetical protein [Cognatiyoonia sp. IB215182]|uniref:hypothetical protein n=1 Tax=Cognatiyoonia sp. IB215182 TaxID=3097353 RepID=UPI002A0BC166|nr:hypothetical protein [Cognatiyoonia sp. IB215182]MDX8355074.1 hypothetical protein [Cognatiyoonia sp. IB215182]